MSEKMIVACPDCGTRFVAPLEKFLPDGRKVRCAKCGHSWFHRVETESVTDAAGTAPVRHERAQPDPVQPQSARPEPARPATVETAETPPTTSIMDRAVQATNSQTERPEPTQHAYADTSGRMTSNISGAAATTAVAGTAGVAAMNASHAANEAADDFDDRTYSEGPPLNEPSPIATGESARKRRSWIRFVLYLLAVAIIVGALAYFLKDPISKQVPALAGPLTTWKTTVDGVVSKVIPSQKTLKIGAVEYDIVEADGERVMLLTATVRNEGDSVTDAPKLEATLFGPDKAILETVIVSPEEPVTEIGAQATLPYFLRLPYPPVDLEGVEVDFAE